MDVAKYREQICIRSHHPRVVAALEEMTRGLQLHLESPRVTRSDLSHQGPERRVSHLDEKMQVVRHPAVGMDARVVKVNRARNNRVQQLPVAFDAKKILPMVAAQCGVVERIRNVDSQFARHGDPVCD
jgi:hypothetical protein